MNEVVVAQQAIEQVLSKLHIKTVVCVDDVYGIGDIDGMAEPAIGWFHEALLREKADECNALVKMPDFFNAPDEVWTRRLRTRWRKLSREERLTILGKISKLLNIELDIERDEKSASLLRDLIPEGTNLRELSPADWEEEEAALFEGATKEEGLLCLFDHNLQGSPGYSDSSGILLLSNAVNERGNRPIICGLLTHTVREGQEIRRSSELAKEHGLNRKDFLVLSKDRLSVPMRLAHGLKMMSLNYARDFLTDQIKGIATEAGEQANQQLMKVDIYNFDYMVLRSSEEEGLWEAETLFRLFDIFRLAAFREKAFAHDNRQILDERIAQIRAIREVATVPDEDEQYPPDQEWEVRQLELYASENFINTAHLPLELGDIFAVGERRFVLLAQPCDLMVRKGGKRQLQTVSLVKITSNPPRNPRSGNSYILDYFDELGKDAYVKFRSTYQVSASVLDLAVFNPNGRCKLGLQSTAPPVLHSPWRARFEAVKRELGWHQEKIVEILSELGRVNLTTETEQLLEKSLTGRLTQSSLSIPLDYDLLPTGVFSFEIRRIGRYRKPNSARLLGSYFAFLSRDAVDHDYVGPKPLSADVWECKESHEVSQT